MRALGSMPTNVTHCELSVKAAVRSNLKLSLTQRQKAILQDGVNLADICEGSPDLKPRSFLATSQPLRFPRTRSGWMSRFQEHRNEPGLAGNNELGDGGEATECRTPFSNCR